MAKRTVAVELDEETIRGLAELGDPAVVLADLAESASAAARGSDPGRPRRDRTDQSLRVERDKADSVVEAPDFDVEREATDTDLAGERDERDSLLVDQREANTQMVRATLEAAEAQERAEESARALAEVAKLREMFIAILGHDLRNPVAAITMGAAQLLRRGQLDEHDSQTVGRIIATSQRIGRMIIQLLDLTRARLGGGLPLDVRPADLREICEGVAAEFEAPIELELAGDLTGTWDPDRLTEVLSNLAGNAVQYGAPGSPVTIAARAEAAEVVVEIRNHGRPIPAELLPLIFEPFRRANQRAKSPTGNLGLGLYIARQIVLAHGGTLDARSAEGTTSFTIRLPRQR